MIKLRRFLQRYLDWLRRPNGFRGRKLVRFGRGVKVSKGSLVELGDFTFIGSFTSIGPAPVVVGRYCSIGPECVIGLNSHPLDHASTSAVFYSPYWGAKADGRIANNAKKVTVGNDVWIGIRAMVMPGVSIGDGAVVGAGAIVTRDVAPYTIVAGSPARVVGARFSGGDLETIRDSRWFENDISALDLPRFLERYTGQRLTK